MKKKITLVEIAREVSKIKVDKKLNLIEDSPFFEKKIEKANKMVAVAGLPK
jgi:hypothetical protein